MTKALDVTVTNCNSSRPEERAHRLARLDGVETGAKILGTLFSPITFKVNNCFLSFDFSSFGI